MLQDVWLTTFYLSSDRVVLKLACGCRLRVTPVARLCVLFACSMPHTVGWKSPTPDGDGGGGGGGGGGAVRSTRFRPQAGQSSICDQRTIPAAGAFDARRLLPARESLQGIGCHGGRVRGRGWSGTELLHLRTRKVLRRRRSLKMRRVLMMRTICLQSREK